MEKIVGLLEKVIHDDGIHARFLNSLSYLEYRGARKIARALQTSDIDDEVLTHFMEESRHALYFKKLAMKLGGKGFHLYRPETLLAEAAAKRYFYELDSEADRILAQEGKVPGVQKTIYYFVTWLIEERAIRLYEEYETLLRKAGHSITLKPVLADEDRHLHEMKTQIERVRAETGIEVSPLLALENRLFHEMWAAMGNALP